MTGAPGVLLATLGPGVANAVNVVANAEQDRVPLIFITGCVDPADAAGYTHQVFDHGALLRPITKASLMLTDGAVALQVDKALAIAMEGRPGPVHLDLPIGLAGPRRSLAPGLKRPRIDGARMAPAPGPALQAARKAFAERLAADPDRRPRGPGPGGGAVRRQAGARLRHPGHHHLQGQGRAARDRSAGARWRRASRRWPTGTSCPWSRPPIWSSWLATIPIEMRQGWCEPWDPEKTPVIEFTAAPNHHGVHRATTSFHGDIAAGLAALCQRSGAGPGLVQRRAGRHAGRP